MSESGNDEGEEPAEKASLDEDDGEAADESKAEEAKGEEAKGEEAKDEDEGKEEQRDENESIGSNEAGTSELKEQTDQKETEQEEEEDPSNLQLAWEIMELAKHCFKKQADSLQTEDSKRMELEHRLSEIYLILGEISLENENYPQVKRCLSLTLDPVALYHCIVVSYSGYRRYDLLSAASPGALARRFSMHRGDSLPVGCRPRI